jgi:hypothetical protein
VIITDFFGPQDLGHRLAPKLHQLALKASDARLTGVGLDDAADRVLADGEFLRLQRVIADHLWHQMPLGDLDLLVLGVAGDTDDLHAVHQGRRDVQRVRRRHEHHARQVVFDLEVMVHERRVLLGIEHLQQGRRRIAAEIHSHLNDLVEQE